MEEMKALIGTLVSLKLTLKKGKASTYSTTLKKKD
jgi:hypothetical protein